MVYAARTVVEIQPWFFHSALQMPASALAVKINTLAAEGVRLGWEPHTCLQCTFLLHLEPGF